MSDNHNTPEQLVTVHHRPNNLPSHKGKGLAIASVTFAGPAGLPFTYCAVASYTLGDDASLQAADVQAVDQLADDVARLLRHRFAPPSASNPQTPEGR